MLQPEARQLGVAVALGIDGRFAHGQHHVGTRRRRMHGRRHGIDGGWHDHQGQQPARDQRHCIEARTALPAVDPQGQCHPEPGISGHRCNQQDASPPGACGRLQPQSQGGQQHQRHATAAHGQLGRQHQEQGCGGRLCECPSPLFAFTRPQVVRQRQQQQRKQVDHDKRRVENTTRQAAGVGDLVDEEKPIATSDGHAEARRVQVGQTHGQRSQRRVSQAHHRSRCATADRQGIAGVAKCLAPERGATLQQTLQLLRLPVQPLFLVLLRGLQRQPPFGQALLAAGHRKHDAANEHGERHPPCRVAPQQQPLAAQHRAPDRDTLLCRRHPRGLRRRAGCIQFVHGLAHDTRILPMPHKAAALQAAHHNASAAALRTCPCNAQPAEGGTYDSGATRRHSSGAAT